MTLFDLLRLFVAGAVIWLGVMFAEWVFGLGLAVLNNMIQRRRVNV